MALLPLLLVLVALPHAAAVDSRDGGHRRPSHHPRYARVFSFGDSFTDTGNAPRIVGRALSSRPPYGETFFHRPTGRASDGRLVIDFIVEALGVPNPTPYLAGKTTEGFRRGVNFAVGGATALDPAFFAGKALKPFLPVSLRNQTSWFKNVLKLLGSVHEQRKLTTTSLFIVGEMGTNDYLIALIGNRTVDEAKTFVPHIIDAIRSVVTEVIAAGASTVVVPGMIPLGCEPLLLARYKQSAGGGYDPESGCLTQLNDLAEQHNRGVNRMLGGLRRDHPGTAIVYADLYRAITDLIVSPSKYGFRDDRPPAACCPGRGTYNINLAEFCGAAGTVACADPSEYVSWDGAHFTEAANRRVACAVLDGWDTTTEAGRRRVGCA